jgi:hypothetical protein
MRIPGLPKKRYRTAESHSFTLTEHITCYLIWNKKYTKDTPTTESNNSSSWGYPMNGLTYYTLARSCARKTVLPWSRAQSTPEESLNICSGGHPYNQIKYPAAARYVPS